MLYEFRTRPDIVWPHHEDVYELRATALRRMILASIAFAVLWVQLQITPYSGALRPDRLIGPLLLGGSGALAYKEHAPAHFHAVYVEHEATIGIDPIRILQGHLPRRVQSLVFEWAAMHQVELRQDWELAQEGKPLQRIPPLD